MAAPGYVEIAGIIAVIATPIYILLIWLIRSYSDMNREIGELAKDVEQNRKGIEEIKDSVDRLLGAIIVRAKDWLSEKRD